MLTKERCREILNNSFASDAEIDQFLIWMKDRNELATVFSHSNVEKRFVKFLRDTGRI